MENSFAEPACNVHGTAHDPTHQPSKSHTPKPHSGKPAALHALREAWQIVGWISGVARSEKLPKESMLTSAVDEARKALHVAMSEVEGLPGGEHEHEHEHGHGHGEVGCGDKAPECCESAEPGNCEPEDYEPVVCEACDRACDEACEEACDDHCDCDESCESIIELLLTDVFRGIPAGGEIVLRAPKG